MEEKQTKREPLRVEVTMTSETFIGCVTQYLEKRYEEWTQGKNLRCSGKKQNLPGNHYWSVRIW